MDRFLSAFLLLCSLFKASTEVDNACPFDLKDASGWDMVELDSNTVRDATYGIPKHSFGYRFITESPTGFVKSSKDATKMLSVVFEPFLYKLNATKSDLIPRRLCRHDDWKEKLDATDVHGEATGNVRNKIPRASDCSQGCGCYLRYSDACPTSGYKTVYLPVPWWWCYYKCSESQNPRSEKTNPEL